MKSEFIMDAMNYIDEKYKVEALCRRKILSVSPYEEKEISQVHRIKKISRTALIAAVLAILLVGSAFAVWSIHSARQQEIKADLKIEENKVSGYVEYDIPEEPENELVLLSSVNDGDTQRVYVNISPVSEEDAAGVSTGVRFAWSIDGTEISGFAGPMIPSDVTLQGPDEVRKGVLKYAYDNQTQVLTLECYVDNMFIEKASAALGTDGIPLLVHMIIGDNESVTYGPVTFVPTEEQTRYFDFGYALYHDEKSGNEIEIVGLELSPFSAVWKVHYEGADSFHTPEADWEAYAPWSALEDKIGMKSLLVFSDGSSFSTGGALTTPYKNGMVELHCAWGSAINIDDVQQIVLDDLVLWENM